MAIDIFFSDDKGVDREKITNAIRNGNISEDDFELLISQLREKNYFRESNFQKNEDKNSWTQDYVNKLNLNSLLYFSEDYLRHLREVSLYVNNKKKNYKYMKYIIAGIIVLAIILVLLSKK